MPRTTFLRVIRRSASMSMIRDGAAAIEAAAFFGSGKGDVLVPQRCRADAFSRCREIRIKSGGARHAVRRLADAPPDPAARHDDRLDLRHLGDPHRIIVVEIRLFDAAILDGAPAIEQAREAIEKSTGNAP